MHPRAVPSYANESINPESARKIHKELYRDTGYDAMWRLTNSGFVIRLGTTYLFLDPVLTAPLPELLAAKDRIVASGGQNRRLEERYYDRPESLGTELYDSPLPPEQVEKADFVFLSHDHGDHFDTAGLAKLAQLNPTVVAPGYFHAARPGQWRGILETGIPKESIIEATHGKTIDFDSFSVEVIPADHSAYRRPDPGACGYLIKTEHGNIYHPGDTNFDHPGKETICNLEVDYLIVPICDTDLGAGFGALLTFLLQPQVVIPCHYGYTYPPIRSQGGHPAEFVTALGVRNYRIPRTDILILQPGGKVVLT